MSAPPPRFLSVIALVAVGASRRFLNPQAANEEAESGL
jgi:hypothetical protein